MNRLSLAVATAATLVAAPLAAQSDAAPAAPSTATAGHFFVALHGGSAAVRFADSTSAAARSGGNAGLELGFGFGPRFVLISDMGALFSKPGAAYGFAHIDAGARYSFSRPGARFVPFLEGAYAVLTRFDDDVTVTDYAGRTFTGKAESTGGGYTLGAGLEYYLRPKWALTTSAKWTRGTIGTMTIENATIDDLDARVTSTRLNVGLAWHPAARP